MEEHQWPPKPHKGHMWYKVSNHAHLIVSTAGSVQLEPENFSKNLTDHQNSTNLATNRTQTPQHQNAHNDISTIPPHPMARSTSWVGGATPPHTIANPSQASRQCPQFAHGSFKQRLRLGVEGRGKGQRSPSAGGMRHTYYMAGSTSKPKATPKLKISLTHADYRSCPRAKLGLISFFFSPMVDVGNYRTIFRATSCR